MNNYYSILTNAGIQKEILSKQNGSSINLAKMAVGSGEITPTQTMTSLKSEKYRFNINSILQSETNPNHLIVEGVIPSNVGGFEISEIGIYLDDNTFYAVGNLPKTYKPLLDEGSAKDLTIKMFIEVSNSDSIVLKVDDSVVLATRNFVQNELKKIVPSGVVFPFATNSVPDGFLECNGVAISRTVYAELFSKIGTTFGVGNGTTTFNIPDIRDRFPRGRSSTRAVGLKEEDAIRNITGTLLNGSIALRYKMNGEGAFYTNQNDANTEGMVSLVSTAIQTKKFEVCSVTLDTSKIVPTAPENRPKSITLMFCIKY